MSDRVHRKRRATLPEGYQFGDARFSEATRAFFANPVIPASHIAKGKYFDDRVSFWRAPHENAGEQLKERHAHNYDIRGWRLVVAAHG